MQTQTLNIALPKELVKQVDKVAAKEFRNRSELIREVLRIYLEDKNEWEEIFRLGEITMKRIWNKSEKDIDKIVLEYRHGRRKIKSTP